jgi:cytochrome c oxidase subunit II
LRRNCEAFPKSCIASEKTVQRQATCDIRRETLPRMKQVAADGALWLMNVLQRFAAPGLLFMAGRRLRRPRLRRKPAIESQQRVDGQGKGHLMRVIAKLFMQMVALLGLSSSVLAQSLGRPEAWQYKLQPAATPVMRQVEDFHTFLMIIISSIVALVLGLLLIVIVRFNARSNPTPSRTTHNTLVEVLWTVVPVVILVMIAIPSFRLLYLQRVIPPADMTVKITGNKWYWSYEYPDQGGIAFDSNMLGNEEADAKREPRYLAVDNPMVVPANKTVRIIVTASDVIHAWALASFGQKIDAVPGRLNEDWFLVDKPGVYYGQCSELCGKDHAFMPITLRAVPEAEFNAWVQSAKTAGVEEANKMFAKLPSRPETLASTTVPPQQ